MLYNFRKLYWFIRELIEKGRKPEFSYMSQLDAFEMYVTVRYIRNRLRDNFELSTRTGLRACKVKKASARFSDELLPRREGAQRYTLSSVARIASDFTWGLWFLGNGYSVMGYDRGSLHIYSVTAGILQGYT